ncbi:protein of unknown function DUF437 [Ferroglobus placidus DSM 10642]|uniref:ASCH domain-containing protein n=1 Tax=Ferroglobus placidus (strain DSM 10642 / AEDII12DO) TaxID=589924 RepID=D3S1S9_FERPA|nr:ASCH domain-containing protein [Ferroglobus placidus]ADC64386.1 protein of unknown function DUF437 [Ferroglobus placidus DSM 10642]
MRGLIVREPYASMIVRGEKVWEIRKQNTKIRGKILIISNGYVIGEVEIVDVLGPFTPEELAKFEELHRVSEEDLKEYSQGKKLYAWVLKNPREYGEKKKVEVPKGAQVWVKL